MARAFLPNRNKGAALIGVSSGAVTYPAKLLGNGSAYAASKLALAKVYEFIDVEYPDVQVITIHPGVVLTAMNIKSGLTELPYDDGESSCFNSASKYKRS